MLQILRHCTSFSVKTRALRLAITLQNETDEPSLLIVNFHANKTCPFGLIAHLFIS